MSIFEPEETVGLLWHRLVGASLGPRTFPRAAVRLEDKKAEIGMVFRACGGAGATRVAACAAAPSGHRLSLARAIGLGAESLERPTLDAETLALPPKIDLFPARADNDGLYDWLAAFFAHAAPPATDDDPLRADALRLRAHMRASRAALAAWPGLRPLHARLARAVLAQRPKRRLPKAEGEVEAAILALLDEAASAPSGLAAMILGEAPLDALKAPPFYRTFLPVPLWGDVAPPPPAAGPAAAGAQEPGGDGADAGDERRRAKRQDTDRSRRGDPLMLHRFESILTVGDMINVNRAVEDDDEESARKALKDTPELAVGDAAAPARTRLRIDIDLPARRARGEADAARIPYPEWDWRTKRHLPAYCLVRAAPGEESDAADPLDAAAQRRIRDVRRRFEALRPRRQLVRGEPDGDDFDLSRLVRAIADRRAGGAGADRVYEGVRRAERDLSVAVLVDVSLSTDASVRDRRVIDVEKDALLALSHGLSACGDEHAIFAFSSQGPSKVDVAIVKGFDERLGERTARRVAALKPRGYTRMGAALRHVGAELAKRPHRLKLTLLITDGKPNDLDHYEGRFGVEDARQAILESRRLGLRAFGVAVDERAPDYLPYLFGRGAYAIVADAARLPVVLPAIYRQITA